MEQELLRKANEAAARARLLRDSKLRVGAALLANSGKVYLGANIESETYGLTVCAERVALFSALMAGESGFRALALTAHEKKGASWREKKGITPCGACRQLLREYAPGLRVWLNDGRVFTIEELLPEAFGL